MVAKLFQVFLKEWWPEQATDMENGESEADDGMDGGPDPCMEDLDGEQIEDNDDSDHELV